MPSENTIKQEEQDSEAMIPKSQSHPDSPDSNTSLSAAITTTIEPPSALSTVTRNKKTAAASSSSSQALDNNIPVQAYAKLEGEDFCYYIRTLQVTLGRKAMAPDTVDIPLGNTKSVSRHHARLFYNFTTQRFEMMVFGKNGAFVNERFVECGATVPLENRTKIQIGDVAFVFLLPRIIEMDESDRRNTDRRDGAGEAEGGYISTPRQLEKNRPEEVIEPKQNKRTTQKHASTKGEGGYNYNKNVKPPYSYAAMIAQAINSCPEKKMTLSSIYAYITSHFPYYQMTQNGWQNSIRHNLSLNKAFLKVPRKDDEPGKGAFWAIDKNVDTQFLNGIYKRNKRASPQQSNEDKDHKTKRIKSEETKDEEEPRVEKKESDETSKTDQDQPHTNATISTVVDPPPPPPPPTATTTTTSTTTNKDPSPPPQPQTQLQIQLQQTIRQHLLDPVRHPLPPSIAQLLPQAIAQLPQTLQTQLSATLQAALRAHQQQQQQQQQQQNDTPNDSSAHTNDTTPK